MNVNLKKETLANWYYERVQGTGRSQSRLIYVGVFLSLIAYLIVFDPASASKIEFFGLKLSSIAELMPTVIFWLLTFLVGAIAGTKDALDKLNEHIDPTGKKESLLGGVWEIDQYHNNIDYLAFAIRRTRLEKIGVLLYPLYILLVSLSAILLLRQEVLWVFSEEQHSSLPLFIINALSGLLFVWLSSFFFKDRWKKFWDQWNKQPTEGNGDG